MRAGRLQHIKSLQRDLTDLPPLDDPPFDQWVLKMDQEDINVDGMTAACMRHVKMIHTMKSLHSMDTPTSDSRMKETVKYRKWSVVASPYDTLSPPMDIRTIKFRFIK